MGYICTLKNCGCNSGRGKGRFSFFRFSTMIMNTLKEIGKLSEARRRQWFTSSYRKEFDKKETENCSVCSNHFISGK